MKASSARGGFANLLSPLRWGPRLLFLTMVLMHVDAAHAAPGVSFSATRLDFGNQLVGIRSTAQTLRITNSGTSPLTVHSISFTGANAGDFVIGSDSGQTTLAPGTARTLGIQCRPVAVGARSAALALSDNATGSPHLVALTGSGVTTYVNRAPRSVEFGNVDTGMQTAWQTITIRNDGNMPLRIDDVTTGYTNLPGWFVWNRDNIPYGTIISPGETRFISVSFRPLGASPYSSTIYIYDSAPFSPHLVTLTGTGVLPLSPDAPTDLTAWVTDTEFPIHLSWSGNAGSSGWFEFDRQMNNWGWGTGGPSGLAGRQVVGTTANTELGRWNQWELNAVYSFRVRAVNTGGASAWSNVVTVDLRIPPTPPSNLSATGTTDGINVSWKNNSYSVSGIEVWRRRANTDWILVKTVTGTLSSTINYGMTPGVLYTYRLRAVRAGVASGWSTEVSAMMGLPPSSPSNLTAAGTSEGINLSWTNTAQNVTAFEVWRLRAGTDWLLVKTVPGNLNGTTNWGMTPGVTYTFRVRAIRNGISSGWSNEASAIRTPSP